MKPIVHPVYKKSLILKNPNPQLENLLEPWFNGGDGIIVEVDGNVFTQQDYQYIQQLSEIIANDNNLQDELIHFSDDPEFELGNLKVTIKNLETLENKLIKI